MTFSPPTRPSEPDDSTALAEPAPVNKALVAVATIVVLGAIAWGSMAFLGGDADEDLAPASTGSPITQPWRPTDAAARTPGDATTAAADRPVVLFNGPLTVGNGLGVDLDRADPEADSAADSGADSGATDSARSRTLDVYWDQRTGLSVADGKLFSDQGLPQDAATRCAGRIRVGRDGYPSLQVFPGDQLCLMTSDSRIAWLRVGEGAGRDDELAVQATVWDSLPG